MLRALSIRNYVIVDRLELEFAPGFTALTGETGAGKSILIGALSLVLGERADSSAVRPGCERAEIEAEFELETGAKLEAWLAENDLAGDPGVCLLRRVVEAGGRSRGYVNGRSATLAQLRDAGERLIEIHGQHEHQQLLRSGAQRQLLDSFAGTTALAGDVAAAFSAWRAASEQRSEAAATVEQRRAEREQVEWQVAELARLALEPGEWQAIGDEHQRLAHAASLIAGAQEALSVIADNDDAVASQLTHITGNIRELAQFDKELVEIAGLLESSQIQLSEAEHGLRRYAERVELDPQRLAEVERRLDTLHGVARRFRVPPEELRELQTRLTVRFDELSQAVDLEALAEREREAESAYRKLAEKLSAVRRRAGGKLSKDVSAAMQELAMQGGRFEIALQALDAPAAFGLEQVEFLVAGHAGIDPRPLAKVASGGELSRVSLAIQVITSKVSGVRSMIFDEVDAGIGGRVAEIVGRLLQTLGETKQVLCVTHLPQVAARAERQYSVAKREISGAVKSEVHVLDRDSRVDEIARMLGGAEITPVTRRHAQEMLGK
jgi:DNA repair protein RecN (Recombination protein N)